MRWYTPGNRNTHSVYCLRHAPRLLLAQADAHFFDLMWSKYWAATLSSDPLASTQEFLAAQMKDLCRKLDKESTNIGSGVQAFAALEVSCDRPQRPSPERSPVRQQT